MNSGIYQIMNKQNYRMYVGSSFNLKNRWKLHKKQLNKGVHHSVVLQRAWNKYGEDCFEFSEIEFVDRKDLIDREQHYLDLLKPEYNICKIAGSTAGAEFYKSIEHRLKLSISHKGRQCGKNNPMFGVHRFGAEHPMYGRNHSDETKHKISIALKGRPLSEETKQKQSISHMGIHAGENNPMSRKNRLARLRGENVASI